jgi:hypothetical protein
MLGSLIGLTAGLGLDAVKKAKTTSPASITMGHPANADRTSIGYDVLDGGYTPVPSKVIADGFEAISTDDINPTADYSSLEWRTNANINDTPARSNGVAVPSSKTTVQDTGHMRYQGYDVVEIA